MGRAAHTAQRGRKSERHVRLYGHELNCPAYRALSTDARALLIELRWLYVGQKNEVFLSIRDMMQQLNAGQKRAQKARDELLEKGWIAVIEQGGFNRKTRHATVYCLLNEPLDPQGKGKAPKDYMRWKLPENSR